MTSKSTPPRTSSSPPRVVATAGNAVRHNKFIDFLDRMGYEPAGRYAKAGKLRAADVETLMQGTALAPTWEWVQTHVKTPHEIDILRRNLRVAAQLDVTPDMAELKQARLAALAQKRSMLQNAVTVARAQNKETRASIAAVESAMARTCDPLAHDMLEDTYKLQVRYRQQEREACVDEMEALLSSSTLDDVSTEMILAAALASLADELAADRVRLLDPGTALFDTTPPPAVVQDALGLAGTAVLAHLETVHQTMPPLSLSLPELMVLARRNDPVNVAAQIRAHVDDRRAALEARRHECRQLQLELQYVTRAPVSALGSFQARAAAVTTAQLDAVRQFCEDKAEELAALDEAKETIASHMQAMQTFDARVQDKQALIAAAFQRNRARVLDILEMQSQLLLFLQTHVVDSFRGLRRDYQVALDATIDQETRRHRRLHADSSKTDAAAVQRRQRALDGRRHHLMQVIQVSVAKLDKARMEFMNFQQTSPCFAMVAWEGTMSSMAHHQRDLELVDQLDRVRADIEDNTLPDVMRLHEVALDLLQTRLPRLDRAIYNWFEQPAQYCEKE
ncbi:Aste57867_16893 [Aphanomyces stellatus]|uniref:Aste57867_16893 protein n=1 Tax=Aphanomyces stellatus TaxID=120398 RepID=A0A485L7N8_9STRA|nr:hypothetical protein As57867_016835 [Aphanomyces stellatus]VFT93656.1 Aste57867_16893 [Aphanomyces stellatus]